MPKHPKANSHGQISEHLLVWENMYGVLPENHVIHHLNGLRGDNRIENLIALPLKNGHHGYLVQQAYQRRIQELESEIITLKEQIKLGFNRI